MAKAKGESTKEWRAFPLSAEEGPAEKNSVANSSFAIGHLQ